MIPRTIEIDIRMMRRMRFLLRRNSRRLEIDAPLKESICGVGVVLVGLILKSLISKVIFYAKGTLLSNLYLIKFAVQAALGNKLVVFANFNNMSVFQNYDLVSIYDC